MGLEYKELPDNIKKQVKQTLGYDPEELKGKHLKQTDVTTAKTLKVIRTIARYTFKGFLAVLLITGIAWGILFLVIYLSAR